MEKQHGQSGKWKQIAIVAIVGFAVAALVYKLEGGAGQGCSLLNGAAWFVLQILHPVLTVAWQSVGTYVPENTKLVQHLPDIVAAIRPLLCAIAG